MNFLNQLTMAMALIIGLILAGLYFFLVYDDGSRISNNNLKFQNDIKKLESKLKENQFKLQEIQNFDSKKQSLGENFEKLIKFIPKNFNVNDQMKMISDQAKSSGANIVSIKQSGGGQSYKFYQENLVNVELTGTYSQVVLFLSYLTKVDRVIVLKKMKMFSQGAARKSDFDNEEAPSISFSGTFAGYKRIEGR